MTVSEWHVRSSGLTHSATVGLGAERGRKHNFQLHNFVHTFCIKQSLQWPVPLTYSCGSYLVLTAQFRCTIHLVFLQLTCWIICRSDKDFCSQLWETKEMCGHFSLCVCSATLLWFWRTHWSAHATTCSLHNKYRFIERAQNKSRKTKTNKEFLLLNKCLTLELRGCCV